MSTATDMRDLYLRAEAAILSGQSFEIGGRKLTRADLAQVISGRKEWEQRASNEAAVAAGQGPLSAYGADFSGGAHRSCDGDGWSRQS